MTSNDSPSAEWHALRTKTRCTSGAHEVTGADIARIARTLAMEPWHFTQTAPAAADDPIGIVLDGGRRRVRLNLATAAHGCVFLVETLTGVGRCGLGDTAPLSCRHFRAEEDSEDGQDTSESDRWRGDVARWNVLAGRPDFETAVEDLHRYVLEAEYSREAGMTWPEDVK